MTRRSHAHKPEPAIAPRGAMRSTLLANAGWRRRVALRSLLREIAATAPLVAEQSRKPGGRRRWTPEARALLRHLQRYGAQPLDRAVGVLRVAGEGPMAVVRRLADDGLIELLPGDHDGSPPRLRVTATGEYHAFELLPDEEPLARALDALAPEQFERAVEALRALRRVLQEAAEAPARSV